MAKLLTLLLVGLSVGLGNFAASIAIGLSGVSHKLRIRIALVFGVFETGMPIVGLVLGKHIADKLGGHANLYGGILLILTGLYILKGALVGADEAEVKTAAGGWGKALAAGLALSIDNLIVGFGLGTHQVSLWGASLIIGAVSVSLSLLGLELGGRLSSRVEEYSEILSGLVLLAVGVAISLKIL